MKFRLVAEIFDAIEQESSRLEMTRLLANLFKKSTSQEAAIISYMALGELRPIYEGTQFNVAEKSLVNVIANFLSKPVSTIKTRMKKLGDLGLVVLEHVTKGERQRGIFEEKISKKDLSVSDVYTKLEEILEITGVGSQEKKENKILSLLKSLDSLSAKYIIRIILGKLRLGFSDMTLLDAFSWMVAGDKSLREPLEDAYNVSADIGLIVKVLKEKGVRGIKKMRVVPGVPIRPAAAERLASAKAIVKKLDKCVAQPKLDGFRLQVHLVKKWRKTVIHFFSRNLQDMTHMFPELTEAVKGLKVKSLVVEGEAIAYDQETGTFLPFQETVKRRRKYDVAQFAQDFPLKLYLFDILYLNGKTLLDKEHIDRRKALLRVVGRVSAKAKNVVYAIEEKEIEKSEDLETYFNKNISAGLEGLVVKKIHAPYKPGKRNFNWVKLKREETGHLEDTIDCVVLGYYAGHGKRALFGIGAFLVGVLSSKKDAFQTVAKVGTGLTDAAWKDLKKRCDSISYA